MRFGPVGATIIGVVLAAGCTAPDSSVSAESVPSTTATVTTQPSTTRSPTPAPGPIGDPELTGTVSIVDVVSPGADLPQRPFDGAVAHTIRDNEDWWAEIYPELFGAEYAPIEGGFFPGYPGRDDPIPGCPGPEPMTMSEIESFLALYCGSGDFFAYDDSADGPLANLIERYGNVVIAVILSHEWAHAIEPRAGIDLDELPTILSEQQADCFAGAWAQRSMLGDSRWIHLDEGDIDAIVRFYGEVADPADEDTRGANRHGSYLDRIGAFGVGFDSGPRPCVDLIDVPLPLLADVATLGVAAPTTPALHPLLNDYWGGDPVELIQPGATTGCDRWVTLPGDVRTCPSGRLVEFDFNPVSSNAGFGEAALVANAWALLNTSADTSATAQLRRWCEVGRWFREMSRGATSDGSPVTTGDIDAGLRAVIDASVDLPLLAVSTSYRRGVVNGTC